MGGVCRARGVNMIPSSSAAARATRVLWPTSLGFLLRVERESVGECDWNVEGVERRMGSDHPPRETHAVEIFCVGLRRQSVFVNVFMSRVPYTVQHVTCTCTWHMDM